MSDGLKHSTLRKYRNSLALLQKFCDGRALVDVTEIVVDTLDAFRASRGLSLISGVQELKLLRQFFKFCLARHWGPREPGLPRLRCRETSHRMKLSLTRPRRLKG